MQLVAVVFGYRTSGETDGCHTPGRGLGFPVTGKGGRETACYSMVATTTRLP